MEMYNITLISTFHSEVGNCNSEELYKIIESIDPEVIFEELPVNLHKRVYEANNFPDEPLELKCIRKYLETHHIKNIPVYIDPATSVSKRDIENMFNLFKKYPAYNQLEYEQYLQMQRYGFAYLNSDKYSEAFEQIKAFQKNLLGFAVSANLL
ncbi:MAG TPA: hypothetical protein VHZ50_01825, partial [Puia sp.]|nr:hypothetical protein [Puia sp.]